jgi:uncharacterized protein
VSVPARLSLVTLGVSDLARATAFYDALGWRRSGASVPGVVSFFHTAGALLSLFSTDALAKDAGVAATPVSGFRGVSLAVNVADEAEVDAALNSAVAAGGSLVKAGQKTEWGGYGGYFSDPDGHHWEVAFNPFWPLDDDGLPTLPS